MKTKTLKRLIAGVAAVLLTAQIFTVTAFAATDSAVLDPVAPQYEIGGPCSVTATVSKSGLLTATVSYNSVQKSFNYCDMVTYVERKNLGLIWGRVNIGTTDNEWQHRAYYGPFEINYTTQLKKTGTYRVTTEFTFTSTSKQTESATKTYTITY